MKNSKTAYEIATMIGLDYTYKQIEKLERVVVNLIMMKKIRPELLLHAIEVYQEEYSLLTLGYNPMEVSLLDEEEKAGIIALGTLQEDYGENLEIRVARQYVKEGR